MGDGIVVGGDRPGRRVPPRLSLRNRRHYTTDPPRPKAYSVSFGVGADFPLNSKTPARSHCGHGRRPKVFENHPLALGHVYQYTYHVQATPDTPDARRDEFRAKIEPLWPLAKGSVSEVRKPCGRPGCRKCQSGERHPALIFTYRKDGRLHCRNVKPSQEAVLRKAAENGRRLERLLVEQGEELLRSLRG